LVKRIVIIQGHPDPKGHRFGHTLEEAYSQGAQNAGHDIQSIHVAKLDFPLLRTQVDYENSAPPEPIRQSQKIIQSADHLVILYPLWLGTMPALLKAFFEQVFRPGFALEMKGNAFPKKLLKGKSARVIVTMGMPAIAYRYFFRAHGLKNLERNILKFSGIYPVHSTIIGGIETPDNSKREKWLEKIKKLGAECI